MKKTLIIISILVFVVKLSAQTWDVPEDKKTRVSPLKFSRETVTKGQDIFKKNCSSCHGEPTKGNFQPLLPPPGDPATDKFQKQTDGALFYKITTGRGLMPTFKDVISEEERWNIISYFRSFNKNYVQPDIKLAKQSPVQQAKLTIGYDSIGKKIKVLVTDTLKKPLKDMAIILYAKRYFGNLPLGEAVATNENGLAVFDAPKDLPGDKMGLVTLIAKLTNEQDGDAQKTVTLAIGIPTNKPPLTQPRAMWNVGAEAPVWLLLSYTSVVLVIWAFLGYIVYLLVKLKKAKKENIEKA
jgi:hypothetical protein